MRSIIDTKYVMKQINKILSTKCLYSLDLEQVIGVPKSCFLGT